MADNDQAQVEAMRLMVGSALQQMGRDLEGFHKKAKDAASASGGFKQLDAAFAGLSKTLIGPLGLAAGFYAVAKSLESVAASSIQLRAFANNTGFAVSQVEGMQQGMRRMGLTAQEANTQIGNLGNKLNNLAAFKEASEFWQTLSRAQGGAELANRMKDLVLAGNQMGAVAEYLRVFNLQSREGKIAMAQYADVTVDSLEKMSAAMRRNIPVWERNMEEAQKYHDTWVDWEVQFDNIWKNITDHGIKGLSELSGTLSASGVTAESTASALRTEIDRELSAIKSTVEEIKAIRQWYNELEAGGNRSKKALLDVPVVGKQPFGSTFDFMNKTPADLYRGLKGGYNDTVKGAFPEKYPQGDDPMGRDYIRDHYSTGPRRINQIGGATDFSGMRRTDDLIRIEDDSNILLRDVRDTLQRIETGSSGGSGEHVGGGVTGRSRATLGRSLGMNNGSTSGGIGIASPGSNNPGNLKMGPLAQSFGAVGEDEKGFAIFPDSLSGSEAQSAHQSSNQYKMRNGGRGGLSSADDGVGAGLSGSDFMAARRSRFAEEAKDPNLRERMMAMMSSEGTPQQSLESLANRMDYSGRSLASGLTPAFYGPMRDGKFNQHLAKIRSDPKLREKYDRMIDNVLVKGSNELGGRTDQGLPSDPNGMWGYGTPVWMKKGGNVFTDWGGGPGGHAGAAKYRRMIEQGTAGEIGDRSRIDAAQSQGGSPFGKINASVEFLNVPNGVKTKADSNGDIFQQLQISRTKQAGVYSDPLGYE